MLVGAFVDQKIAAGPLGPRNDGGYLLLGAAQLSTQVTPCGVEGFYERELAGAVAGFELLFSGDGGWHGVKALVPNQKVHVVLVGEAVNDAVLVLPDASWQIAGDADVKHTSRSVGQDVDAGEFQRGSARRRATLEW